MDRYISMLETTQNTRDLGGYRNVTGKITREGVYVRSDVQYYPSDRDCSYLRMNGITTVVDMRSDRDVMKKPSGFATAEGFDYRHFPIEEGSGVPASVEEVPASYMRIASARSIGDVFSCLAAADGGVMFNCTAGKDRTGVVSAILLLHAGVSDRDIIDDYVLTREYGKERLELVHQNYPEIDMRIVTPCENHMAGFLTLFREKYGDTEQYFRTLGLNATEIARLRRKLAGP